MRRAAFALVLAAATAAVAAAQEGPPRPAAEPAAPPVEEPAADAEIADLIADLGAAEAHVRAIASDGLVKRSARSVTALVAALEGPNPRARVEAARTLGRIAGPAAAPALDALREAAAGLDAELAGAARAAITEIESGAPSIGHLTSAIRSGDPAARIAAIRRLPEVPEGKREEVAELLLGVIVQDPDEAVRIAAIETAPRLGVAGRRALPGTLHALADGTPRVRAAAVGAQIAFGETAVFDLLNLLADSPAARADDRGVRPWVLAALAEIPVNDFAWNARAPHPKLAAAEADFLGVARPAHATSVAALAAACGPGRVSLLRRRAALALGALGDDGTNVAPDALVALLADRESRAQVEAATALRQILVSMAERPWKRSVVTADVQTSIYAGVAWLVAHQDEDGGWDGDGFEKHDPEDDRSGGAGKESFDEGLTALATLALARSGAVPAFGAPTSQGDAHGTALRRALVKLISIQDREGCYGARGIKHWIYTQAIGTLAMVEAHRRTGSPLWGDSAQRGLDFLAACRNPVGSWRYDVRPTDADTSVNGWVVQAMRAGERAGLRVDRAGYAEVLKYLDSATDAASGRVGYQPHTRESARTNEMLKKFPPGLTTAMTSSACVQRFLLGRDPRTDALLAKGLDLVRKMPPVWDAAGGRTDLYSWMAGAEALSYAGGDGWTVWKKSLRDALLPAQCDGKSGARAGSWDPADPWGPDGGRIYATAAAVLCLEAHQGQIPPLPRDAITDGRGLRIARALEAAAKDPENHESVREAARAALDAVR